jgi:hypothetical protein
VGEPDHVPVDVVRVWPSALEPEIAGRDVFAGADVGAGAGATTTAVAADDAAAEPPALVAVTTTRIVRPTSPEVSV